jgi:hypothetical protein
VSTPHAADLEDLQSSITCWYASYDFHRSMPVLTPDKTTGAVKRIPNNFRLKNLLPKQHPQFQQIRDDVRTDEATNHECAIACAQSPRDCACLCLRDSLLACTQELNFPEQRRASVSFRQNRLMISSVTSMGSYSF